jgi:hypothetical protein
MNPVNVNNSEYVILLWSKDKAPQRQGHSGHTKWMLYLKCCTLSRLAGARSPTVLVTGATNHRPQFSLAGEIIMLCPSRLRAKEPDSTYYCKQPMKYDSASSREFRLRMDSNEPINEPASKIPNQRWQPRFIASHWCGYVVYSYL